MESSSIRNSSEKNLKIFKESFNHIVVGVLRFFEATDFKALTDDGDFGNVRCTRKYILVFVDAVFNLFL